MIALFCSALPSSESVYVCVLRSMPTHYKLELARTMYIYTVYDRIIGDFPAKNTVCSLCIYMVLASPNTHTHILLSLTCL